MKGLKVLIGIVVIAAGIYFGVKLSDPQKIEFPDFKIRDQYTVSQLVVEKPIFGSITAATDVTVNKDADWPLYVIAVFYGDNNKRLAVAKGEINGQLYKGDTTTVKLKFDNSAELKDIKNVRMEIRPVTPLETLQELAETLKEMPINKLP